METYTVACIHCGWEGQDIDDHEIESCRDALSRLLHSYQMARQQQQADDLLATAEEQVKRYEADWEFGGEAEIAVFNLAATAELAMSFEVQDRLHAAVDALQDRIEVVDWAIEQHKGGLR
jgi:FtsZ-binding cell division protein ZapB